MTRDTRDQNDADKHSDEHAEFSPGVIRVHDQYYILAGSNLADGRTRVIKQDQTFGVFDPMGDIHPVGGGQQGLYYDATRHLSRLELHLDGKRPILLSSTVTDDNAIVAADLTNPHLETKDGTTFAQDSLHLFRSAVIWGAACHQRVRIRNFARDPVSLTIKLVFEADFADIFEVRGLERARRGHLYDPRVEQDTVTLDYEGLDTVLHRTELRFEPTPTHLRDTEAHFELTLAPGATETVRLEVRCDPHARVAPSFTYEEAADAASAALASRAAGACRLETANEQFNDWINRSDADLRMMLTDTPHGSYPYAGVPWFSAPFGRDGIVTALETLWLDPSIAAAVLRHLAVTQAHEEDPNSDAEPGKILHEARGGEMSALGEVPFHRYYGTIDATPLFVMLAHAYFERTADREMLGELWPHIRRALDWIDAYGDPDGDGFVEYQRRTPKGLVNQGWKDSQDAVFHDDGTLAEGSIALCEVQAYVYGAKHGAAELAAALGDESYAQQLRNEAVTLQRRFEQRFWQPEFQSYVLALDGRKRACRVRSSNAGHCLFTGIVPPSHARAVADTLMEEESFSGWGIRTIATSEKRYNPMSYHNGSVWPHDNAIIAAGLARYGLKKHVLRILEGLFDASLFVDLNRMPELLCGFARRPRQGPTLYPVACAPQSWAAGAVFLLVQACLGLTISAISNRIIFNRPVLPPFLEEVRLAGLRVGHSTVDIQLRRYPEDVGIRVLTRDGNVEIISVR